MVLHGLCSVDAAILETFPKPPSQRMLKDAHCSLYILEAGSLLLEWGLFPLISNVFDEQSAYQLDRSLRTSSTLAKTNGCPAIRFSTLSPIYAHKRILSSRLNKKGQQMTLCALTGFRGETFVLSTVLGHRR